MEKREKNNERESSHGKKRLRVKFNDGTEICRQDRVTDTYIDCLDKIGLSTINSLGISARDRSFVNLVSETTDGRNYSEVNGWFVYRKIDIKKMRDNLTAISNRLGLNLKIDIFETGDTFRPKSTLRIFLDGEEITRNNGARSFAEAIHRIGETQVEKLGLEVAGHKLVSRVGGEHYTPTGSGFYVWTKTPTQQKANLLTKIAESTGRDIRSTIE